MRVPAQGSVRLRLRLTNQADANPFASFDKVIENRRDEADAFYAGLQADLKDEDARRVHGKHSPA